MRLAIAFLVPLAVLGCKEERREASPLARLAASCSHDAELSCPRPIFSVGDLAKSTRYYRQALGFRLDWDHGEPATFASVSRGDSQIFLCEQCQGSPGAWAMVFARDLEHLHEEFVKNDALVRMPPTDMPWGVREMHVADPDGNVIRFGGGLRD